MNGFNNIHPLFHFLICLVFFFIQSPVLSRCCHDPERNALLSFKSSLNDPSNRLSSWKEGSELSCCKWHGIRCSDDSFHVIALDLRNAVYDSSTALNGTISPFLFNLTHLQYLDLSWNDFQYSQIPYGFGNLKNLTHLDLSYSEFSGSITTQLANLSSLSYLDVSSTIYFDSSLFKMYRLKTSMNWLRGLVNLKVLRLDSVDLSDVSSTNKNWAEPILDLSNLWELYLSNCNIQGSFPTMMLNLSQLKHLDLSSNKMVGLPFSISNKSQVKHLDLSDNEVTGQIPSSISNLSQLKHLDLADNQITGHLPSSISDLSQLEYLGLHDNEITGQLPPSISNLSQLKYLDLSKNKITGQLPSSVSNLSQLEYLYFTNNNLTGQLPSSISNLSQLKYLILDDNNITGYLPSSISNLRNLKHLSLTRNKLQGSIPESLICKVSSLQQMSLTGNNLTGPIPSCINNHLQNHRNFEVSRLKLGSCNLEGYIPSFICNFTHLDTLDLSHNNLIGDIPFCLFKLPNLIEIDLSKNNLQGTLPHSLKFNYHSRDMKLNLSNNYLQGPLPLPTQNVEYYDLSQNNFTGRISFEAGKRLSQYSFVYLAGNKISGSIPFSLCSSEDGFMGLQYLDLSNNQLIGTIPSSLGNCTLSYLNLGRNNLTGNVPSELMQIRFLLFLQLNDNTLNGTFPNFIQQLESSLVVLNLANNNFRGSLPTFIGSLDALKILSLRSNAFSGSIPKEINHLHQLQILDLSSNNFSGPIPQKIGNLKMLTSKPDDKSGGFDDDLYTLNMKFQMVVKGIMMQFERLYKYNSGIDLSCNNLEGNIPDDIGLLKELVMLNLSYNSLSGHIPKSFGKMIGLQSLDLSHNKLSGDIPQTLTSMDALGYFNLSYNNLSGRIPEGRHLETLGGENGSAYFGNYWLCGPPTNKSCLGDHRVQEGEDVEDEDASDTLLFCGIVFLGFGVGFWGLFLVLLLKKEKWWFGYWRAVDSIAVRIAGALWRK